MFLCPSPARVNYAATSSRSSARIESDSHVPEAVIREASFMLSLLPPVVVLGLAAFAALRLALRRTSPIELIVERITASRALALATVIQSGHFAEEWATDFHARFPALFGLEAMPLSFFAVLNLTWIAIWIVSVPMLRSARKPAFFAAWFLAIAGMLNGVAHPLIAIASGTYFPGLITSPFIGLASVNLWKRLHDATLACPA
jgi:hypothetical protein